MSAPFDTPFEVVGSPRAGACEEFCRITNGSQFVCTATRDHDGPHVTYLHGLPPAAVWPRRCHVVKVVISEEPARMWKCPSGVEYTRSTDGYWYNAKDKCPRRGWTWLQLFLAVGLYQIELVDE